VGSSLPLAVWMYAIETGRAVSAHGEGFDQRKIKMHEFYDQMEAKIIEEIWII